MATCKQCGAEFGARRSTAQYCSAACRAKARRAGLADLSRAQSLSIEKSQSLSTKEASRTLTEPAPVDYSSLPAGVVRPLGAHTAATRAMSDELIETRLAGLKTWQASPEYAERIGRLMAGATSYNLPCWCRK